jgi:hypothetical protein
MSALRTCGLAALLIVILLVPGAVGPLGAASIWAVCMFVLVRSSPRGVLSLPPLYLAFLGLFHLGLVVPMALGARPTEIPEWTRSPQLGTALSLVAVACVAFTLGAAGRPHPLEEDSPPPISQRQLFQVGVLAAIVGAAFLWIGAWQLGVMSSGYGEYFERAVVEDVRLFGFGLLFFPIGVLVASAGATPRKMLALGGLVLVVLGPLFLTGFRGPTLVLATALLAVWERKQRLVARGVAIAVVAAAIVLVPAIRATRDRDGPSSASHGPVDPLAGLYEAGGSLYPLVVTAEAMRYRGEPPWMGRSWEMAVERVLPNLGARPATGDRSRTPSGWATLHADPWAYENGYGIGYSGVAEPYLNFGVTGVVGFFLLLGLALRRSDGWLASRPFRAAVAAAAFKSVLWTVRNDAMELPRSIAFAGAIALGAWAIQRLRARDRSGEALTAPGAAPAP